MTVFGYISKRIIAEVKDFKNIIGRKELDYSLATCTAPPNKVASFYVGMQDELLRVQLNSNLSVSLKKHLTTLWESDAYFICFYL